MRRPMSAVTLRLLALAAAIVLLGGCSSDGADITLTEKDTATEVTIAPNTEFTVELESNPSTGYQWVVASLGPTVQVGTAEYVAPDSKAVGAPGKQRFTFKTKDVNGFGQLKLYYERSWETTAKPAKAWLATIVVK